MSETTQQIRPGTLLKKNTKNLKHVNADNIAGIHVSDDGTATITYVSDGFEFYKPITREAYNRAKNGAGSMCLRLRNKGITHSTDFYRFIILLDTVDGTETVVGIHCHPRRDAYDCDWSVELKRPVDLKTDAVVTIHPETGELDLRAFPYTARTDVNAFLSELEKLEAIDNMTTIMFAGKRAIVTQMFGTEVSFHIT